MDSTRVSIQHLSKAFARRRATRERGISTEGPAALRYLLQQVFRREAAPEIPRAGDKRFLTALDDVSFDVAPGEVVGIIGRNGAGKSTLLKILARVLHPTSGRVVIHGRIVSMLELGVGFAPNLTVRQNIQIHGRLAGIPARQVRAAEAAILDFSGLTAHADSLLGACPGGSAVQLGFAAVMCLGAEIVLADEVLAVGDADFRRTCEDKVREAGRAGGSVLFVSHDMAAIRRICTRVIWIDRGRIVRDGPAEDVVLAYMTELLQGRLLSPLTREGLAGSCTLLDLRLLDRNHSQVGALQVTEPGYIDCLFRVTRPDVAITVTIELRCGKQSVFTTTSAPVTTREAQTFRAGVLVPADLLNELPYAAVVTLHAHALDERPAVAGEDRLEFSAMNPHPERSVWRDWAWGRGGVISPRLPWSVEALGVHETPSAGAVPGAPA